MPFITFTAIAVASLLLAEYKESRLGVWLAKPAAAAGFIAYAISLGAWETSYGSWILAGLVLSFGGDVLLIPRGSQAIFQAGVGSFLLGHVAYSVAFAVRGVDPTTCAFAAVVAAAPVVIVLRWLRPHVPSDMKIAVYAYVAVISTMVVLAAGTVALHGKPSIALGAVMFYCSDLAVARDRFVSGGFENGAWGLPLYFGGQLVIASTVG